MDYSEQLQAIHDYKKTSDYRELQSYLSLIWPENEPLLEKLAQGSCEGIPGMEFLYSDEQIRKFEKYVSKYNDLLNFLNETQAGHLVSEISSRVRNNARALEIIILSRTTSDMAIKKAMQKELNARYASTYGEIDDEWIIRRLTSRRAQQTLEQCRRNGFTVPKTEYSLNTDQIDLFSNDEYSLQEIKTFAQLLGLPDLNKGSENQSAKQALESSPKTLYLILYEAIFKKLLKKIKSKNIRINDTIQAESAAEIATSVLKVVYRVLKDELDIVVPHKRRYKIKINKFRGTMVTTLSRITLPAIPRNTYKLITLIFHEIGTHALKTIIRARDGYPKTGGNIAVEEGFCFLLQSYYYERLKIALNSDSQQHTSPDRTYHENNEIYSFVIALVNSGIPAYQCSPYISQWLADHCGLNPGTPEHLYQTKVVLSRVFRGCIGNSMVFSKDRIYADGVDDWKRILETVARNSKASVAYYLIFPTLWLSRRYDPFDRGSLKSAVDSLSSKMKPPENLWAEAEYQTLINSLIKN